MRFRRRVYEIVETADPDDRSSQIFDVFIITLICLNVVAFVLSTMPSLEARVADVFWYFEVFSVAVFTAEYAARIWSCTAAPAYEEPLTGRLRFAGQPLLVIDLLAILPFYLPVLGLDLRALRVLRVFRVFRVLKLARYSDALRLLGRTIAERKEELLIALGVQIVLLLFAGTALFYVEHPAQPEEFSSIPAAMWYGIATLSTVGYGDMTPITGMGRFLGSMTAILGVGMFALPAGILGAAFTDAIQRRQGEKKCPDCGTTLEQIVVE